MLTESIARAVCRIHRIDRASLIGRDRTHAWARRQLVAASYDRSPHRTGTNLNKFFGHHYTQPRFDRTAVLWHMEQHTAILHFALFDTLPAKYATASRFHTGRGAPRYAARWFLICEALDRPFGEDIVELNFTRIAATIRQERELCLSVSTQSSSDPSVNARTSATLTNSPSRSACGD